MQTSFSEDATEVIDDFSECLKKLANKNKTFLILGDIDLSNFIQNSAQAEKYI